MPTMQFEVLYTGSYRTTDGGKITLADGERVWASSLDVQVRCYPDTIAVRYLGRDVLVPEHLLEEVK